MLVPKIHPSIIDDDLWALMGLEWGVGLVLGLVLAKKQNLREAIDGSAGLRCKCRGQ
jgi:hypothetical protein